MNKSALRYLKLPLLAIIILLITNSCKKEDQSGLAVQEKVENARIWYANQMEKTSVSLSSKKGDSTLIKNKPQWADVQTHLLEDQSLAIIIPVKSTLYENREGG